MLTDKLIKIIENVAGTELSVTLSRPQKQFGHFATNVAMKLAKKQGVNPRKVADKIAESIATNDMIEKAEVAGPGFINITLTDQAWLSELKDILNKDITTNSSKYKDKIIVTEYSDPNPFKELHIGHLYTTVVGDAVSNLIAAGGGQVHKVNFGGDVGMHVAKAMWAIIKHLDGEHPNNLDQVKENERPAWLSARYVEGASAFEDDDQSQAEIKAINKKIYKLHTDKDHDSDFARIYWTCRQWSYDYFDNFYESLNTKFEKYYPESENAVLGAETVKQHVGDVYTESDGAIVFMGEDHDLHTRVFINNEGLPTYEAKDVGLALAKKRDYDFDQTVIITGNDIAEYMKVVIKSLEQFEPEIAHGTVHITHGQVKMTGGVKMSSRLGNVLSATEVIEAVRTLAEEQQPDSKVDSSIAAIKYGFLKQSIGPDVIFDAKESVSLEGKSGPYLQYANARASSILAKADSKGADFSTLEEDEADFLRKIAEYKDVLRESIEELAPHKVALYLYDLAQTFNRFYEKNRVLDDPRSEIRVSLVKAYQKVLRSGLKILNIETPKKM